MNLAEVNQRVKLYRKSHSSALKLKMKILAVVNPRVNQRVKVHRKGHSLKRSY